MVQLQRAKGEVIVRDDGDGEDVDAARLAAGRTSSAQASSSAAKRKCA